jgi:hypothetical protein
MALQKTIESDVGIEIQNAYILIDEYSCVENNVNARIRAYVSKDMKEQGKAFISGSEDIISLQCDYSDMAINTKKQIYEYMKTLDKYKDSTDC